MSRTTRLLIATMLVLSLSGASCQTKTKPPEIVYVTVEKLPELTPEQKKLLADCPIAAPDNASIDELYQIARERKLSLEGCNLDKRGIRGWFNIP